MDNKIISFDIAKINRGREKLCRCENPSYEIDTVNRLVMCMDCGAVVDPFDVCLDLAMRGEEIERAQKKMLEKVKIYKEQADKEFNRKMQNRIFKEMDAHYIEGFFPICPECGEVINPTKINKWFNAHKSNELP